MITRYRIREPLAGKVLAVHVREDTPDGKTFWWELPDGSRGLGGLKTADLPLFGAAAAHRWDTDEPVILCEGEKAALACHQAGYQSVGTITGASGCPSTESLAILAAMAVVLWPDADDDDATGRQHMLKVARALGGGVATLAWVDWADAPPGGDAADALAVGGTQLIDKLVAEAGDVPVHQGHLEASAPGNNPRRRASVPPSESPIDRFNTEVSVTDVLARDYGIAARPGRAVKCPRHDDRSPSLSVLPDDRRAFCHSPGCELNNNGRGRDAWDLAQLAQAVPA